MASNTSRSIGACCFREKRRLVEELSSCGYCSSSFEEYKRCRRKEARDSSERSKSCTIG